MDVEKQKGDVFSEQAAYLVCSYAPRDFKPYPITE
jgi:hypothetical protein